MGLGTVVGVVNHHPPLGGLSAEAGHAVGEGLELLGPERLQRLGVEVDHGGVVRLGDLDQGVDDRHVEM
jgi:hypothetical protein